MLHATSAGSRTDAAEVAATRETIGWPYDPFTIPDHVYAGWDARSRGAAREGEWNARFATYGTAYPAEAAEFRRRVAGRLPEGFHAAAASMIDQQNTDPQAVATRKASQSLLAHLVARVPELLGGSADLTGSNLTHVKGMQVVGASGGGRTSTTVSANSAWQH